MRVRAGAGFPAADATLNSLVERRFATRLFARDATLWSSQAEASTRLGWVDVFARGDGLVDELNGLRAQLRAQSLDRIVLCGMGGSSLGPEVISRRDEAPLILLDTTHPAEVARALEHLERTVVVVSSKSGSTIETRSHLFAFEEAFDQAGIDAAGRIIVVTDPDSALHLHAQQQGYRTFLGDPEVGGRFSVLTAFGLVPAVLAGADGGQVLAEAQQAARTLCEDSPDNPALQLAAFLHAGLPQRFVCFTAERRGSQTCLPDWIEQLVAESTGKHGRGILPISLPAQAPELRSEILDNAVALELALTAEPGVRPGALPELTIDVMCPLGAQFLLWEVATAALGHLIGVDPFDQPDVESAKSAARSALEEGGIADRVRPVGLDEATLLESLRAVLPADGYVAIQAFVDRSGDSPAALSALRDRLANELAAPVSLGYGPRYLHSTGQFHKGGPGVGVFVQVIDYTLDGNTSFGGTDFAALITAQAAGDRRVLEAHGRPVYTLAM